MMGNRCHKCGAPMVAAGDLPYASSVDVCSLKGSACNYAAGLRERAEKAEAALARGRFEGIEYWKEQWSMEQGRAERAETALRRAQRILSYGNVTDKDALVALSVVNEALEAEADADIAAGRIKPAKPPRGAGDD